MIPLQELGTFYSHFDDPRHAVALSWVAVWWSDRATGSALATKGGPPALPGRQQKFDDSWSSQLPQASCVLVWRGAMLSKGHRGGGIAEMLVSRDGVKRRSVRVRCAHWQIG